MSDVLKIRWVYWVGFSFIAANLILIYTEQFWFSMVPMGLFLLALALLSMDKLLLFIVFFTPLSINLAEYLDFGLGLYVPTEPLMAIVILVFLLRVFYDWKYDSRIIRHPVTIMITVNLIWIGLTCITSEEPTVSIKFFISRLWVVICFYFIAVQLFRNIRNIRWFPWVYAIPLTGVVIYTIVHHATFSFDGKAAHWVMQPFYNDHTSYGAILALFIPFLVGTLLNKRIVFNVKIAVFLVILMFIIGLVLSYTRAAWLSLIVALLVGLVFIFKIKFRTVLIFMSIVAVVLFSFQKEILNSLAENKQDSSTDLVEHAQSISNIASDASNLERINRWKCAWKMFTERPVVGWGPGTYAFYYAPFQNSNDLTIISTNFGNKGNAHSEYLGPLAESGLLGCITFTLMVIIIIYRGTMRYIKLRDKELKLLLLTSLMGLITYFVHGILNNFLDTDKASVPFWGFVAIVVAIDVYHKELVPAEDAGTPEH